MADPNRCPECGAQIFRDDFQCAACGLLLRPERASGEYVLTDPSIIRALFSPPDARPTAEHVVGELGEPIDEVATARYALPLGDESVPQLRASPEQLERPMHPFEAQVASFIDGRCNVRQLIAATRMPPVEAKAILITLHQRGLVSFEERKQVPIEDLPTDPRVSKVRGAFSEAVKNAGSRPAPVDSSARARPAVPSDAAPRTTPPSDPRTRVHAPNSAAPPGPASPNAEAAPPGLPSPEEAPSSPTSRNRAAVERALAEAKSRRPLQETRAPELPDRPEEYLQRAVALERDGKVDGAIYVLNRAIAQVKRPAPLYNKLALILLNQRKDYAQAEALLRKAVAAEPSSSIYQQNLYTVLGLAAEQKGAPKPAGGLWTKLRGK